MAMRAATFGARMHARTAAMLGGRRMLSSSGASAAKPLPFETPLFESAILRKEAANKRFHERLELVGNVLVIASGMSLLYRMGYYMVYGKEGGAGPLPRRDRDRGGGGDDE